MSRTIHFFHYTILKDNQKTDIELIKFIREIIRVEWQNRLRKINNFPTGLFDARGVTLDDENKFLVASLGKFREDYKPFIGDRGTQRLQEIKNEVVEMTHILVDTHYQVIVVEYNQHGVRYGGVEEYINTFLPYDNKPMYKFKLTPIFSNKGLGDIAGSDKIRNIELKLKLSEFENGLLKKGVKIEDKTPKLLLEFLGMSDKAKEIDARTLRIEFGAGQSTSHSMDIDSVMHLLHILDISSEAIDTLKVRFKDSKSKKTDEADLKNSGGQLRDTIFENEDYPYPTLSLVGDTVANKYMVHIDNIRKSYLEYKNNRVHEVLPPLTVEPLEEYIVPRVNER